MNSIRFATLTVSDRCSRGEATDTSGPAIREFLFTHLGGHLLHAAIVPDEIDAVSGLLQQWCDADTFPDLIFTTGGTGLGPRDVTPEATMRIVDRPHPGIAELIRGTCGATVPRAYLSRGVAGVRGRTLIINLPGSPTGAVESLAAIKPILKHAVDMLRGADHPRVS